MPWSLEFRADRIDSDLGFGVKEFQQLQQMNMLVDLQPAAILGGSVPVRSAHHDDLSATDHRCHMRMLVDRSTIGWSRDFSRHHMERLKHNQGRPPQSQRGLTTCSEGALKKGDQWPTGQLTLLWFDGANKNPGLHQYSERQFRMLEPISSWNLSGVKYVRRDRRLKQNI